MLHKPWQLCVRGSRLCVKILCVTLFVKNFLYRSCYFCYQCNCFVLFGLHVSHFKYIQSRLKQSWQLLTVGIICKGLQTLDLNLKFTWLIYHFITLTFQELMIVMSIWTLLTLGPTLGHWHCMKLRCVHSISDEHAD